MLVLSLLPLIFGIFLRVAGYGDFQYYPTLKAVNPGFLQYVLLALLVLLLLMIIPLAHIKRRTDLD